MICWMSESFPSKSIFYSFSHLFLQSIFQLWLLMLKLFAALHPCPPTNTHMCSINSAFTDSDIHHKVWEQQGDGLASSCSRKVKGFQSVVQQHTRTHRNLLEMNIFKHLPRQTKSENLGVEFSSLVYGALHGILMMIQVILMDHPTHNLKTTAFRQPLALWLSGILPRRYKWISSWMVPWYHERGTYTESLHIILWLKKRLKMKL